MHIGIVIYSLSGHTLLLAEQLKKKLSSDGHTVALERVETVGPGKLRAEGAELKMKPAIASYDALVFGTPVRGGALPSPMRRYLEQIPSLQDMQIACYVTHFFRPEWGAHQTLTQMKAVCEAKGAAVHYAGSLRWFSLHHKQQTTQIIDDLYGQLIFTNRTIPGRG